MHEDHGPRGKETDDARMLHLAERNLERILNDLDEIAEELEARAVDGDGRAKATAVDLRKAIQTVFDERQRIEKIIGNDTGSGDGFDLDAARAEIGRRLALLRK